MEREKPEEKHGGRKRRRDDDSDLKDKVDKLLKIEEQRCKAKKSKIQ